MALRIGVAQMFILETPNHAAVNTSVDLATLKWRAPREYNTQGTKHIIISTLDTQRVAITSTSSRQS